jgi:hypothetical protein
MHTFGFLLFRLGLLPRYFLSPKAFKASASFFSLVGEETVFNRNWPVKGAEYLEP